MDNISLILLIIIITSILLIIFLLIYNHFQTYIIKINIAENNIDNTLREKFDFLAKGINIIADKTIKTEKEKELNELKEMKISNFELDRELVKVFNNYITIKEEQIKNIKNFNELLNELKETDEQLTAYKGYYNKNIIKYNKMVKMFPSNIVSKIARLEEKPFYDGKDMTDDDEQDFKL
ncbi:MAG: LemA family protein [Bacilli bacterium]|nr:LemA family protein [Bacilli bacterium]